ncbi:MAG TPA: TrmH family RNA methyltransferase [Actinomycetota bacterium]|nr:TrmH family RNA methyltransferase [Actinomycetota bacterium]
MITSVRNRRIATAAKLRKRGIREQHQKFLVEGAQATAEALAAGVVEEVFSVPGSTGRVPEVAEQARASGIDVIEVGENVMAHLTSAVTPQGLAAVARFVDVPLSELTPAEAGLAAGTKGIIPVLCSVRDPGNAGAILRSADASGAGGVVFSSDSVDVYNAKTVRASAGSLFHLPVVRDARPEDAVPALAESGAQVLAASADGEMTMYEADLTGPTVLLLGNEAWGLPAEIRGLAEHTVRVPIEGKAESLNLAAAAALLLFESARQRSGTAGGLSALIANSVHDMRVPLTGLKGFASTLVDRWEHFEEKDRRRFLEGILIDVERLSALIALLVDAARLEHGRGPAQVERREVAETLKRLSELFVRTPDYPQLEVAGEAEVAIEPERLRALLLVLCEGAMWWGHEGPIRIEARPEGSGVAIEVARRGGGPKEADIAAMFDASTGEGPRIGLHVARLVAEAHGGTLTCEGGDGVRYRLRLP